MLRIPAALAAGLLFGLGLVASGMVNPAKVLGFLDIAGDWDPSLAFVIASPIPVAALGFRLGGRMEAPFCAMAVTPPARRRIDARLLGGAALFGIGWGHAGFCPGPALASLGYGGGPVLVFVAAMLGGAMLQARGRQQCGRAEACGQGRREGNATMRGSWPMQVAIVTGGSACASPPPSTGGGGTPPNRRSSPRKKQGTIDRLELVGQRYRPKNSGKRIPGAFRIPTFTSVPKAAGTLRLTGPVIGLEKGWKEADWSSGRNPDMKFSGSTVAPVRATCPMQATFLP